jgi:DNA-binding transcriptional MerR regulator
MPAEWTLDELVGRVSDALGAAGYPGAPNGRVRELPDRRAIRWYTTIGLLDRPAGMRGRTALYGERHLAQLVAIKRLQSQGHSLADIQAELVGATDTALMHIAGLEDAEASARPQPRLEEAEASARPEPRLDEAEASARPELRLEEAEASARPSPARKAFWTQPVTAPAPSTVHDDEPDAVLTGVPLEGGAVLLLPASPDPDDVAALRAAAAPLIDLLTARGLLAGPNRNSSTRHRGSSR